MDSILRQLRPDLQIELLPDWEVLPYDDIQVPSKVIAKRLDILSRLINGAPLTLIMTPSSLLQRLPSRDWFKLHHQQFEKNQIISLEKLLSSLQQNGFTKHNRVEKFGQYATRGDILDFFPSGTAHPVRIEFFDDEISRMQIFDIESQRSITNIETFTLTASREFVLTDASISSFRHQWREQFDSQEQFCPIFKSISSCLIPAGIEFYLPLLHTKTTPIFDFVEQANLYLSRGIVGDITEFLTNCQARYQAIKIESTRNILPVEKIWVPWAEFRTSSVPNLVHIPLSNNPWKTQIETQNHRTLFCYPSATTLAASSLPKVATIDEFIANNLPEADILLDLPQETYHAVEKLVLKPSADSPKTNYRYVSKEKWQAAEYSRKLLDRNFAVNTLPFNELGLNSYVVHEHWGICIYRGLEQVEEREFLKFEFQNTEFLYLPLDRLHLITKYNSVSDNIELASLKKRSFSKRLEKIKQHTEDTAAKLLHYYSKRETENAHIIRPEPQEYNQFLDDFPFQDTKGQHRATHEILHDLDSIKPMDRLLCGDVGYGKTEIAIRAAVATVLSGYQACVMVPTTLLAQQHFESFTARINIPGIQIAKLDSSISAAEKKQLHHSLEKGTTDIIISTQAIVRSVWDFKHLALLVIDEEHRFGVKDKEKLQSYKHNVHVLRMSSTPIPRTLQRAIGGIDQISYLDAPPPNRLPVSTFVKEWDDKLVKDILMREYQRAGQSFVVIDRIRGLNEIAQHISQLLPELTIAYSHGRMSPDHNRKILDDMRGGLIDVLICTNIIQSGLDIPNCNTIIIGRADRTGLAELHQLRGRVGRSDRQSWCWCMHPPSSLLTDTASRRLSIMRNSSSAGAGFELAMNDLEMRGMGELLGNNQSGAMGEIGMQLYCKILQQAINLQNSTNTTEITAPVNTADCTIDLDCQNCIPESYIYDPVDRLKIYQQIQLLENEHDFDNFKLGLHDRYGTVNDKVAEYLRIIQLKLIAKKINISSIEQKQENIEIAWKITQPTEDMVPKIIALTTTNIARYSLIPDGVKIKIKPNELALNIAHATVKLLNN